MSLFLLLVAFVLTGVTSISNTSLIPLKLEAFRGLYLLGLWGSGVVLGLITMAITKHRSGKNDISIGMVMGVGGAIAMILLLLSLKTIPAMVAFPVRSCGNIAITAVISLLAWKERLTLRQWLGIAFGLVSIYLLV